MQGNIPIFDLMNNQWADELGGVTKQIAWWRNEFDKIGEVYPGERVEFEAFILVHGLEN